MRPLLVLVRKDFANFFSNRAAVSLTFVVPFALIWIFGEVFGVNNSGGTGPTGIPLAVVNASDLPAATRLVDALEHEPAFKVIRTFRLPDGATRPLTEADLTALMHDNAFRFALVIPADVVRADAFGLHLKIYSNPSNEIETQMVNGILQKTIFSNVPQLLGQSLQARAKAVIGDHKLDTFNRSLAADIATAFGEDPDVVLQSLETGNFGLDQLFASSNAPADAPTAAGSGGDIISKIAQIETVQIAGRDVKSPAATRVVGGFAIQFLLFALSSSAAALFYERDRGIFQRILATPVTRSQILWSKFTYGALLGLVQLLVLFAAGRLLFGIDVEHHVGRLIIVCIFAAAACTSFGMLIASVASSLEAASGLATFAILVMCAVGGAWFPVSFMPHVVQQLSRLTIVYWTMEGFNAVLWADAPLFDLLPTLGILTGITVAVMAVALWRFNRGRLFD